MKRVIISEDSFFDYKKGQSILKIEAPEWKEVDLGKENMEFLKGYINVLNPLQGAFYLERPKFPYSAIVSAPTSAGKTALIYMYMKDVFDSVEDGLVVYTTQRKALVSEKYKEVLKFNLFPSEVVEIKTGDHLKAFVDERKRVLFCTTGVLSLGLRNRANFINRIAGIVVDEAHFVLNISNRNVVDELFYFILERGYSYLFLSATIPHWEEFLRFFKPDLVIECKWGPIKRREEFIKMSLRGKNREKEFAKFIMDSEIWKKKSLVFVQSKKIGWQLLKVLNEQYSFDVANDEDDLDFDKVKHETKLKVGFHCADLTLDEREKLEKEFKEGDLQVLLATSTLAYGMNFPADVVVIPVSVRKVFEQGSSKKEAFLEVYPDVIECIQGAGRAGRLGLKDEGIVYYLIDGDKHRDEVIKWFRNFNEYDYKKVLQRKIKDWLGVVAQYYFFSLIWGKSFEEVLKKSFVMSLCFGDEEGRERLKKYLEKAKGFLEKYNYVQDGKLSLKGLFAYKNAFSPYLFELVLRLHREGERSGDEVLKFFAHLTLMQMKFDATAYRVKESCSKKLDINNFYKEIKLVFEEERGLGLRDYAKLIDWKRYERLRFIEEANKDLISYDEGLRDYVENMLNYYLCASGVYFLLGLPRPRSDFESIRQRKSDFVYYLRCLIMLSKYGIIKNLEDYEEIFMQNYNLVVEGILPFQERIMNLYRVFMGHSGGYVTKNLLWLASKMVEADFIKSEENDYGELMERLIEHLVKNKKEFLQSCKMLYDVHLRNREKFFNRITKREVLPYFIEEFLKRLEKEGHKFFDYLLKCEEDKDLNEILAQVSSEGLEKIQDFRIDPKK